MFIVRAHLWLLIMAISLAWPAQAKTKIRLDSSRQVRLTYSSASWNTSPEKIDSAFLIFRDAITNRMVQIQLEETEPDSGFFTGEFFITWADAANISPEIYIPSQDLRTKSQKTIFQVISSGKLARKPVIVKRGENDEKVIAVFDTREEAESAWKVYQKELKTAQSKLIKPVPGESAHTAEMEKHKKQLQELADQAKSHESDRERMEREEREKLTEAQAKFAKLSADEQQKRKDEAKKIYDEGMTSYRAGDFQTAEKKFHEAIHIDPTATAYYFEYGVSQYRLEKMNDAMVDFRIATEDPRSALEKKYYMGLIYLRLQELDNAAKAFDEVGAAKDPVLSPSALYYKGVLFFTNAQYEQAKHPFEEVIDTSQDPKLDQQAEEYLDKIANAIAYQRIAEQKWNLTGTVGLMYDSNVLLSPDNQVAQGIVQNKGDVRLLTAAALEYRPYFSEVHEFATRFNMNMMNSSNPNVSTADAWDYSLEAPYTYKSTLFGKGYRLTVRPGYEMLYMALSTDQAKKDILNSTYVAFDNTFVMHENWYATYTFHFRHDESLLNLGDPGYTTSDDNATSNQYYLRTSQMFLLNQSKQEAIVPSGGILHNVAVGKNKSYDRFEVGTSYMRPIGAYAFNIGLNYYYLTYPSADPGREDNYFSLSSGVSKPITEWFTWGVTASYTSNSSTQTDTYQYQKWLVMTTATFNAGW
jgi:tetratricopeptide (TPR) repeat protein